MRYPNIHQELTVKRIGDEGLRIEHVSKPCPVDGYVTAFFRGLNGGRWNNQKSPIFVFAIDPDGRAERLPTIRYFSGIKYAY